MIEIEIEADDWLVVLPDAETVVMRAAGAVPGREGGLVILLTDDGAMRDLNARFRGKDRPTNVLSFPAPESARPHLGDVALGFETCRAEAEAQQKPLKHHLAHLVTHGVLHLMGRDHEIPEDAEVMEAEERTILASLGIPDPYLSRNGP